MKNIKPGLLIFVVAIALALLAAALFYRHGLPAAPGAAPAGPRATAAKAAASWFGDRPSAYGVFSSVKSLSLPERIDLLMASGRPEDAFDAYILVRDCLFFQKHGVLLFMAVPARSSEMTEDEGREEARLCSGLTEPIKTARLAHLAIAANAGVRGSDVSFLEEGPFGDPSALTSRPGDPLVVAWKQQALALLTKNAEQGDMGGLMMLSSALLTGGDAIDRNQPSAYAYALALHEIYGGSDLFKANRSSPPFSDASLAVYKTGLSDEDVAAAVARAGLIKANHDANIGKN
jgi:hypothetical protein